MNVGILHPGLMGETIAANCSAPTYWVADGRSDETRTRAESHDMTEVATLVELVDTVDTVISICPPGAAHDVAREVAAAGFDGLYVDANAISPDNARSIAAMFAHYVDGSVIGPPAHRPGTTRLYLSGERADEIAALYDGSSLEARVLDGGPGAASALKMAYAGWTKVSSALQLSVRAFASAEGIDAALVDEWNLSRPGMADRSELIAAAVSPKAWRFTGEMEQIAAAFTGAGLPGDFGAGAREVYSRMAGFKGASATSLDEVVESLLAIGSAND